MSRTSELLKQREKERGQTASLAVQTGNTGGGTTPVGGSRTQRILTEKGLAQASPSVTAPAPTPQNTAAPVVSAQTEPKTRTEIEQRMKLAGATMQSANQRITGYSRAGNMGAALEQERIRYASAQAEYNSLQQMLAQLDQAEKKKYSLGKGLASVAQKGLSQIAQAGGATLAFAEDVISAPFELISGQRLGDLSNTGPLNRWNDAIKREAQAINDYYAENVEAGGKAAELFDRYGAGAVAALPQAIAAWLTSGASVAAQSTAGLSQVATAASNPGIRSTLLNMVQSSANNPQYWLSFANTVGSDYEEALADGVSPETAALYAIGSSLLNAEIEVGGGIQTLPDELKQGKGGLLRLLRDAAVDEGKEEVEQGIVSRTVQNLIYGKDNPVFSTTDPNAILNPYTAADEFAGGAFAGGLLGGGQIGLSRAGQALYNAAAKRPQAQQENTREIQNDASEAETTQPPAVTPSTPAVGDDVTTAAGADIAGQLVAAGATQAEVETLAPLLTSVLNGEEISGNQAGTIAKNEVAVSILENATGETINTDAPLGEVKTTIRGLASRHSARAEQAATEDTSAQAEPVEAQETATPQIYTGQETAPPVEAATEDRGYSGQETVPEGKTLTVEEKRERFAKALGLVDIGANGIDTMMNSGGSMLHVGGFTAFYNAGRSGKAVEEVKSIYADQLTPDQQKMAYNSGRMDAIAETSNTQTIEKSVQTGYTRNDPGVSDLGGQLSIRDTATVNGIKYSLTQNADGQSGGSDAAGVPGGRSLGSGEAGSVRTAAEESEFSEFDANGNPVYATNREEAGVEAYDHQAMKKARAEADKKYGITPEESRSLAGYTQTTFAMMNRKMLNGTIDPVKDQPVVDRVLSALKKFSSFEGRTYRNLKFKTEEQYQDFLTKHAAGKNVTLKAFMSTSKRPNGYPLFGDRVVHMVIDGTNGADIADTYGIPRQQEVILLPGTEIKITSVTTANDGHPLIYAQEVSANEVREVHENNGQVRGVQGNRSVGGVEPDGDRGGNGAVRRNARDNDGRDGVLPERGESDPALTETDEPSTTEEQIAGAEDDVENMVDHDVAPDAAPHPERWDTERVGGTDKAPMRLSEIVEKIRHDFGLNITSGHVRGAGVRGQYNQRDRGIRSKIANDLPTISHELGHALNHRYGLLGNGLSDEMKTELENALGEMKDGYSKKQWHSEGLAEYIRKFLQNRETAAIDYPLFTEYFLNSISAKDAALIEQLADEINAYYSLDADTATSSIRLREEGAADARTISEKIKAKASVLYQAWFDSNQGIKEFDTATGSNTYKLATNAAYSDAMAGQIIDGDLTDANGQYVAPGLKTALHGLNLHNKHEYRLFGEYLLVKHGPERLAEGMRIFADDRKNSTSFMQRRQAELEQQYPQFKEISERLYEFQKQFLQTWGVGTGLVSQTSADDWGKRWEFYVPLNRAVSEDKRGIGAKRGFANQSSTIKRAHGSGLDVVHPVDNIINNIVKMVNAGVRNNVMRTITDTAETLGADAAFLEKVPTPMVRRSFDMTGVKEKLHDGADEAVMQGRITQKDWSAVDQLIESVDDILYQYGKGKAHGDVITVLKNGDQEFWKINDPLLLSSVTNMAPKKMEGILDAYAMVSRFMTANITGNNIIWSIFSNFPRDMGTFFTYSKVRNPAKVFAAMGSAYANKIKGDNADPLYKEFLAMGGGKTSAYTADRDLAKKARKALSDKKFSANPLDWIGFVSDTVELGPRFATYKLMRQAGMAPQEAFYEAMDITVNFRRGGEISRQINKVVPFFNASVQGLDKFRRWITASDAPAETRSKVVRSRMIAYVAVSAALAALFYGLNNLDDEAEEDYEQLSNYTKNSYWNIPLGDGKYFSIPKPRDLGVLTSFFETCMEYGIGKNDHAFDEFYSYAADNWLPSVVSDLAQADAAGAIGSLGIIGVGSYMVANRDFLGRPIVSSGLQNLEAKDQYNERTSKIAYWVGQAFNTSPQMVDYFFNSVLGGWWKSQKALFPVGKENVDYTLGVQNSYIKDNQYSTDLVNWLYSQAESSQKAKNSDSGNMDKAITYKMDNNMTTFYSRYYKQSKNVAETTATRSTRQTVLSMILEYQKATDSGKLTAAQRAVYAVCKHQGSTENLPSVMQSTIKDGKEVSHILSDVQYVEYQTDYLRLYWDYVEANLNTRDTTAQQAAVLKAAKEVAKQDATNRTLARIGAPKTDYFTEFQGVSNNTVISYKAQRDLANDDGSLKQDEVIGILELMIANGNLSYEEAYILFHSEYTSDKNNPWRQYKP